MGSHPHIVIAGGSGFLGRSLARHLAASDDARVTLLSRNKPTDEGPWDFQPWDARTIGPWTSVMDGADAVVNLVGRSVDCMKTPANRAEILNSRVDATRVIGEAVRTVSNPPPVWVQMSTAHIYGDPPTKVCDESSEIGTGFAPDVGVAWEKAFTEALPPDMRGVILRTSFVLGESGGALDRLGFLARIGLGGKSGNGRQGISWIHEDDMNRIFHRAITDASMHGIYIVTAPNPVSNAQFMRALRKAVGMPIGLPAFGWMVRLGAPLLMRTDPELALLGRYCVPGRLLEEGFTFTYPHVQEALTSIYRRSDTAPTSS